MKAIELIKEWLKMMEHKVISVNEGVVKTYDFIEEEYTENDIYYWSEYIIEILESRLRNNPNDDEVETQYKEEIEILKAI